MTTVVERPNPELVLRSLKDFQRDTVDYVFRRMYLEDDCTRRFLIADEVGLGKTLVARGLIAKVIDHLWDRVERIDVVYICSNADIARQNINRLNVTGNRDFALASRITLLPVTLTNDNELSRLNFISFTPSTSFDLKSNLGNKDERVLLFAMLREAWNLTTAASLNVFQGWAGADSFRNAVAFFLNNGRVHEGIAADFVKAVRKATTLRREFEDLCSHFHRADARISDEVRIRRNTFIGELRALLARVCLKSLQPDLIILDEFQRFKDLLEGESEASQLAHDLFEYSDATSSARVLLLSATPYKMYTLTEEAAQDDHYKDFMRTLRFLQPSDEKIARLEVLLTAYRRGLLRYGSGDGNELRDTMLELQRRLREVMVRTERLAVSSDRNGMLREMPNPDLSLEAADLRSYVSMERIAGILESDGVIEYWKSAPYLLNFMEDYQLKRAFETSQDKEGVAEDLYDALSKSQTLLFPKRDVRAYRAVDFGNARLRSLAAQTIGRNAWRLLWIPPSMPYYRLGGCFADPGVARFTKRLVFSSWRIVPKVVTALLSYEAERRMILSFEPDALNTSEARKRRRRLLAFALSEGRLTGMPVLGIIYPCMSLAMNCDPLQLQTDRPQGTPPPTVSEAVDIMSARIVELLKKIPSHSSTLRMQRGEVSSADERWYWAAPLLLDLTENKKHLLEWLGREEAHASWAGNVEPDSTDAADGERATLWRDHVVHAFGFIRDFSEGKVALGQPPSDLPMVLAQMALGGPGTVALRALSRVNGGWNSVRDMATRDAAGQIAWSFLTLFNLPESMALLRGINREEPYWKRVLEYCVNGCLQAVMDEYAHVLLESQGLTGRGAKDVAEELARVISSALTLRTSNLDVDDISLDPSTRTFSIAPFGVRGRFALRFGEEKSDDGQRTNRPEQVRIAFNSPFWPFVLVSTSVGQEGLDFHTYCHAVVHWNLPANPVDLEQREGRVHRYKGHAIRKNVALQYDCSVLPSSEIRSSDPWEVVFELAKQDRPPESSDLVPYWVFQHPDGAKIERHIPFLPLSRESGRAEDLRRSLALYRLVFGQNRQEDMVAYLRGVTTPQDEEQALDHIRIDLSPPKPNVEPPESSDP